MLHPPKAKSIRSVVPRSDRSLFSRLIVVSQTRSLKLEEVFCFELSALPWSLATVDGGLQKTAKSKMIPLLEKYVTPVQFPLNATVIFDGMALNYKLPLLPEQLTLILLFSSLLALPKVLILEIGLTS